MASCSSIICCKDNLFSIVWLWLLCQRSSHYIEVCLCTSFLLSSMDISVYSFTHPTVDQNTWYQYLPLGPNFRLSGREQGWLKQLGSWHFQGRPGLSSWPPNFSLAQSLLLWTSGEWSHRWERPHCDCLPKEKKKKRKKNVVFVFSNLETVKLKVTLFWY